MTSWPVWSHSSHKAVWGHQNTLQTWILFKVKVFLHFLNPISEFIGNTPSCFRKPYIIIYDFFVTLGSPIPYRRLGSPIPYSRLGSPIPYNSLRSPIKNVVWEFITWLIFWLVYNKFVQAHMLHCLFSFSGKVVMLHVFYFTC